MKGHSALIETLVKKVIRKVVNNELAFIFSLIRSNVERTQRTLNYLTELKDSATDDELFRIFHRELNELLPHEERYLLPSFSSGYGPETDRFSYQRIWGNFDIEPHEKVLDIGSGAYPFPYATHLADLYEGETGHRAEPLVKDGRPFKVVNVENTPYDDQEFDFVYCSHVLEHVSDPARACEELMRIGKRGYIETPTRVSDIMLNFCHLKEHHKWYIVMAGSILFFFEWDERERKDTGCNDFFKMLHSDYSNPFQTLFHANRSLFVNMMSWNNSFHYYIFDKSGTMIATNKRA